MSVQPSSGVLPTFVGETFDGQYINNQELVVKASEQPSAQNTTVYEMERQAIQHSNAMEKIRNSTY